MAKWEDVKARKRELDEAATQVPPPPPSITMYHCDGCGKLTGFNPFKHLSRFTGKQCQGTVSAYTYANEGKAGD